MCTHTHTLMATKTITIMDDAYELLKQEKTEKESFSDVIRKVIPKKKSIWDFVGILTEEEGEKLQEFVRNQRAKQVGLSDRMKKLMEQMKDDMPG